MEDQQDRVYGLHEFVAENADEVSFKVGETIRVVEKDDAYGDGWWQGTNEAGETGLFPFSYTTLDKDLAMNAKALALSAGGPTTSTSASATGSGGTTMKSTMADLDQALDELQGSQGASAASASGGAPRQSFHSQRTAGTADDEDGDSQDGSEYQAQGGARAALAAKAKANAASEADRERLEQQRMKAQAQKIFEEEEERQREMLLQKEAERNQALARGEVDETEQQKPKVAPIAGVDMSDESDSEGSAAGLDDYAGQPQQHRSPLLGAPSSSTPPVQVTPAIEENGDSAKDELDDVPASTAPAAPGIEAGGLSPIPGSVNDHDASTATAATGPTADHQQQERLSSGGVAAGVGAATLGSIGAGAAALGISHHAPDAPQPDQQSVDSLNNRRQGSSSQADASSVTGATTAPTSAAGGLDTPKSMGETSTMPGAGPAGSISGMSRAASTVSNRPPPPPGDPRDWTVDQVVEWARGRGWDEGSVVSKFAEHEISGDVLLEMDVNILKEIDISAFGKRFQVANAIKELKGGAAGGAASMQSPRDVSSQSSFVDNAQPAAAASSAAAAAAGLGAGAATGLGSRPAAIDTAAAQREVSYDRGTIITHELPSAIDEEPNSATAARASSSSKDASVPSGKSLSQLADEALLSRRAPSTATAGSIPPASPRKREYSSQGLKPSGSGDRASFFSSFGAGRGRKAAPASPTGATPGGSSSQDDDYTRSHKGTFSKLGLNRLTNRVSHSSGGAGGSNDFKNQISLPTTSPTYDSMGDTARRNRTSQASNGSGRMGGQGAAFGAAGAGAAAAGRPGSAASSPTKAANGGNLASPSNDPNAANGPVMNRIRPVDMEGWLRKRGDRYAVFKPRYLALKGADLVILRDPAAPKIKSYVSMKGYKVIADENTNPGKYGFKLLHETEKPHYFSSEDVGAVREWMKSLMKATIGRDHSFPVISSYNNPTMSLKDAQRMNPPPRPPSPTSRARMQRARARENPGELTAKDQAVLAGIQQGQGQGQGSQGGPRAQASSDELSLSRTSRPASRAPTQQQQQQPFALSARRKLSFGPVEYTSSKASLVGFQYRKTSLIPPSTSTVDVPMTRHDEGAATEAGESVPGSKPATQQPIGGGGSDPSLATKPSSGKLTLSIPARLAKHQHRSSNDLPGRVTTTFSPTAAGAAQRTTTIKPPSTSPSSATGSASSSFSSSTTPSTSASRATFAWRPRTTSEGLGFSSFARPRRGTISSATIEESTSSPLSADASLKGRKASPWTAALHFAPRSALAASTTTKPLNLNSQRSADGLQRRPSTADGSGRRSLGSLSRDSFRPAMTSLTTLARRPSTSHARSESVGAVPTRMSMEPGRGIATMEMQEVLAISPEKEFATKGPQLREGAVDAASDQPLKSGGARQRYVDDGPSEKSSQGTLQASSSSSPTELRSQVTRQQDDTDAVFWKTPSPRPQSQQSLQQQQQAQPPTRPRPPAPSARQPQLQVQVDLSISQPSAPSPPSGGDADNEHSPSSAFTTDQVQQRVLRAPKFERVLGLVPAPPARKSVSHDDESGPRRSSTEAVSAFFAAFRGRTSTSSATSVGSQHSSSGGKGDSAAGSGVRKLKKIKSTDLSTVARQASQDDARPSSDRLSGSFEMVHPFPPKRVPLDYRPSPLSLSTVATAPARPEPSVKRKSVLEARLERRASVPSAASNSASIPASDESTPAGSSGEHSGATVRRRDRFLVGRRASVASASSSVDSPTRTSPQIKAAKRRSLMSLASPSRTGGAPTTTPSYSPQYSPKTSPKVTATALAVPQPHLAPRPSPRTQLRLNRDLPALPVDESADEGTPQRIQLSDPPVAPPVEPVPAATKTPPTLPLATPPISLTALRMLNQQGGLGLSPPNTAQAAQAGGIVGAGDVPAAGAGLASAEFAMAAAAAAAAPPPAPRLPTSVPAMTASIPATTTAPLATAQQQPKRRLGSDFSRLRLHSRRTASTSNLSEDAAVAATAASMQGHGQLRGPGVEWGVSSVDEGDEEEQISRRRRMRAFRSGYPSAYGHGSSSLGGAVRSRTGAEEATAVSARSRRSETTLPMAAARGEAAAVEAPFGGPQQQKTATSRHTGWLGAAAFWRSRKHGGS